MTQMPDQAEEQLYNRIRAAFYGLAVCDALGAPLEFQARVQDPQSFLKEMLANKNFDLPEGHFTDDTSMALCLAQSLVFTRGKSDPVQQATRYIMWLDEGYNSSVTGSAFDVGTQTRQALQYWRKHPIPETLDFIKQKFNEDHRCGNGSLMRVLPCALLPLGKGAINILAKQSSDVTHPHRQCREICGLYVELVVYALQGCSKQELFDIGLRQQVNTPSFHKRLDAGGREVESEIYLRMDAYRSMEDFERKPRHEIKSSGYVLDSLEAALWAFFTTSSFEHGAVQVVNLGDDADTVGAIYGGLAGAFYGKDGISCIPDRWLSRMRNMILVENAVNGIIRMYTPNVGAGSAR